MKSCVVLVLVLVTKATLEENQVVDEGSTSQIDSDTWCTDNIEDQTNLLNYCLDIINNVMMQDLDRGGTGCERLFYLKASKEYYNGQYGDYFDTADFIYNRLCVDPNTITPIETISPPVDYNYNALRDDPYEHKAPLRKITVHPEYDRDTYESDIAILTLDERIELTNPCVEKICSDPSFEFDGKYCTVSGWGAISADERETPELQLVKVKAYRAENCEVKLDIRRPNYIFDSQRMLCAGQLNGGRDACQGDSGSALVCPDLLTGSFVQVGVVSHGMGCGEAGLPGVYTNIAFYQDWIDQIMAKND